MKSPYCTLYKYAGTSALVPTRFAPLPSRRHTPAFSLFALTLPSVTLSPSIDTPPGSDHNDFVKSLISEIPPIKPGFTLSHPGLMTTDI